MNPILLAAIVGVGCSAARAADVAGPGGGGPVVLELFTSEGCSSCPPADVLLDELGARPDVIALAFHVDYWDDLGWKDPYAAPRWTARQAAYDGVLGSGAYTPQLVVDGRAHVVGSDRAGAQSLIARAAEERPARKLTLAARREGAGLRVRWDAGTVRPDDELRIAVTEGGLASEVTRGENSGRTLRGEHVVRDLVRVQPVSGETTIPLDPAWQADKLKVILLVQRRDNLAIDGAIAADVAGPR